MHLEAAAGHENLRKRDAVHFQDGWQRAQNLRTERLPDKTSSFSSKRTTLTLKNCCFTSSARATRRAIISSASFQRNFLLLFYSNIFLIRLIFSLQIIRKKSLGRETTWTASSFCLHTDVKVTMTTDPRPPLINPGFDREFGFNLVIIIISNARFDINIYSYCCGNVIYKIKSFIFVLFLCRDFKCRSAVFLFTNQYLIIKNERMHYTKVIFSAPIKELELLKKRCANIKQNGLIIDGKTKICDLHFDEKDITKVGFLGGPGSVPSKFPS